MKLQYGIVSCATITDRFIHAVLDYGDEVYAIASRSLEKAQQQAKHFKIAKAYGSYEEMYQDSTIHIVYIATTNGTHVEEIKKALSYGKHVICEKPIALSSKDARDIFAYAKKQNCFLMEAQKSVFLPATLKVKEYIQKQTLGALHQVEMSSSFPNPSTAWIHDPMQGGVIYGSASYTLEYLDYLLEPSITKVSAMGLLEPSKTCERISMNLLMDTVLINSRISMNGETKHHAIFYFEKGYILVPSYWKACNCIIVCNGIEEELTFPISYEMIYEVKHIHECIEHKLLESPIMKASRSINCCIQVEQIINDMKSAN